MQPASTARVTNEKRKMKKNQRQSMTEITYHKKFRCGNVAKNQSNKMS